MNAVFHGHDHFFANQLHDDGIYYLEVGQAGSANYNQKASEYGYISGDFLGSSGYMRVTVNSSEAVLQYVRAYQPDDEGGKRLDIQETLILNSLLRQVIRLTPCPET